MTRLRHGKDGDPNRGGLEVIPDEEQVSCESDGVPGLGIEDGEFMQQVGRFGGGFEEEEASIFGHEQIVVPDK